MKTQKFLIITALCFFASVGAWSQQGVLKLDVNVQAGIPVGDLKTITGETSLRGWSGALMYGITDQFSVGLQSGFQDFYQKNSRQVFSEPGSDISAVVTNSVQTIPITIKGKYHFSATGTVQPFAALGLGVNLAQYRKYYGQFVEGDSRFGFAAQPELGIYIPVGRTRSSGINIAAGYNYMPYKGIDVNGLHHAVIKVGASIPLRQ